MGDLARLRWVVLCVLIAVALVSSLIALLSGSQWQDALLNFGTEMAGAVVTYALFELIIERREREKVGEKQLESRKAELIAQMGSSVRDVAIPATEELRRCGWLQDGSLKRANLGDGNLQGVPLWGASLQEAILVYANLEGAILTGTKLQGANLGGANLQEANLGGANLQGTTLVGANLQGANLRGANLQGAILTYANLQEAKYNNVTIWPEGFTPLPEAVNVDATL